MRYSAIGVLFWWCHVEHQWYDFYIMNKGITVMYYQGFDSASANVMILFVLTYSFKLICWDSRSGLLGFNLG